MVASKVNIDITPNQVERAKSSVIVQPRSLSRLSAYETVNILASFPSEEVVDVILEGEKLPEAYAPTESYNTFLCIAEYQGKKEHAALKEEFDCYVIKDWYPVYPVVRNGRLLPQFCYPRGYMTKKDIEEY